MIFKPRKVQLQKPCFVLHYAIRWRRQWHPTPVLLPGESHGWRSLVGCSPWGHEEWDTTEQLHFHFSLSCIGERHGNPLQCSCLENPRDGRAWWAAVSGVAQSWTRLTRQQQQQHSIRSQEWLLAAGPRACLTSLEEDTQPLLASFVHTTLTRVSGGER